MANRYHHTQLLLASIAATFLLAGCYTQMAVPRAERARDYNYDKDRETSPVDETNVDTTGGGGDQSYADDDANARESLYYDYYPGFGVGVGFGYYNAWHAGNWGYYDPYGYGYSPWYGGVFLPEYPWGWYYPYRSGHLYSNRFGGSHGFTSHGMTRTFGAARTSGATRSGMMGSTGRTSYGISPTGVPAYGSSRGTLNRTSPSARVAAERRSNTLSKAGSNPAVREYRTRSARAAESSVRGGRRTGSGRSAPGYSPGSSRPSSTPRGGGGSQSHGGSSGGGQSRGGGGGHRR